MISSIRKNLINDLPDNFSISYSLTFDENNIINNISFNMVAHGSSENILNVLSKKYPNLKNAILNYDIELSFNMSLLFKDEIEEIDTI